MNKNSVASVITALERTKNSKLVPKMTDVIHAVFLLQAFFVNQKMKRMFATPKRAEGRRAANSLKPKIKNERASSQ